ncbi:MAG: sulfite exporter TauE/SafE family protein [Deltaproteobacteria bacterium]|nr:sulfite exporter TauE/SafE family protein [Deltaproteobacteria bacterium]
MASRNLKIFWTVCLVAVGAGLVGLTFSPKFSLAEWTGGGAVLFAVILGMAFVAEYVDSSLGMGYGTTLTPVLIIVGFEPLQIVPAILLSEFLSGLTAGGLHHRAGNVDFGRGTRERKLAGVLAACSAVGAVAAVALALNLPKNTVNLYIGFMIVAIGLFILFGGRVLGAFSWPKVVALGVVAAFNKGISGGGYGPLITGGQVIVGVPEKKAVGITSLAEGLVCLVGLALYLAFQGALEWRLALPLCTGALLSVPAATWTVKVLPADILRRSIGYGTSFLGLLTLAKVAL